MTAARKGWSAKAIALHAGLVAVAALFLSPFAWMVCAAFKGDKDLLEYLFLPWDHLERLTTANFRFLFENLAFPGWMINSLFLAATHTVLVIALSSLCAYALCKHQFRGKGVITLVMLATMLLPGQVLLPGSYQLMFRMGWLDTWWAVLAPGAVSVFAVFLYRQAMMSVPDELLHAGRIDGCGELRLWWEIVMPAVRPTTAALSLMAFLGAWNSFLWPSVVLQDPAKHTLPIGLSAMIGLREYETNYGILMAGTLLAILPVAALFFALQRDFVAGITRGAVKG